MDPTPSATELQDWTTIEQLCDRYLGGRPAPAVLQILKPLARDRTEVRNFTRRVFQLLGVADLGARNFSPLAAFALSMARNFLPGAWGDKIPPITAPGRHKTLNDYVASNPWRTFQAGTLMMDLGCGFPPTTAVDASQRFPDWQIVGADPFFDPYLLYDRDQSYTCLDHNGQTRYFQPLPGASIKTMEDFQRLRERVPSLFAHLLPKLPPDNGEMSAAEVDGARLVRWPLKQWESDNLKLIQAGVGSGNLPKADLIRCFNVLMYYDTNFLREFETWAAVQLVEGGLLIAGGNSPNGSEVYYGVYRKEDGRLVEKEFAVSAENIRPIGLLPWFSLHDESATNLRLARLIRRIRSDSGFCASFDQKMDELLKQSGLLIRDADGCLTSPPEPVPFEEMSQIMGTLGGQLDREGLSAAAAEVLGRQGIRAWRNAVGHLSVDPATL